MSVAVVTIGGVVTRSEDIEIKLRVSYEQFKAQETAMRTVFHTTKFAGIVPGDHVEAGWTFSLHYLNGIESRFVLLAEMLEKLPPEAITHMSMYELEYSQCLLERMMMRFRALEARVLASKHE